MDWIDQKRTMPFRHAALEVAALVVDKFISDAICVFNFLAPSLNKDAPRNYREDCM